MAELAQVTGPQEWHELERSIADQRRAINALVDRASELAHRVMSAGSDIGADNSADREGQPEAGQGEPGRSADGGQQRGAEGLHEDIANTLQRATALLERVEADRSPVSGAEGADPAVDRDAASWAEADRDVRTDFETDGELDGDHEPEL